MKIIRNKLIPFKGYSAINLFGVLFIKPNTVLTPRLLNHEYIHTLQMKELYYIGFYLVYLIEFVINLFRYKNWSDAYNNISFELEAYDNQNNQEYKDIRKPYAYKMYR